MDEIVPLSNATAALVQKDSSPLLCIISALPRAVETRVPLRDLLKRHSFHGSSRPSAKVQKVFLHHLQCSDTRDVNQSLHLKPMMNVFEKICGSILCHEQ